MKTTENNKLIAEFMEYKTDKYCIYDEDGRTGYFESSTDNKYHTFDTSWDWLMPVVEKCFYMFEIEKTHLGYYVFRGKHLININKPILPIATNDEIKILCVYKAVVKFIKWYNKNKED